MNTNIALSQTYVYWQSYSNILEKVPHSKFSKTFQNVLLILRDRIKAVSKEASSAPEEQVKAHKQELDRRREELLRLPEDSDIDQSVKYLKKTSAKVLNKLYTEYEARRLEKANQFLTDPAISKFADLLEGWTQLKAAMSSRTSCRRTSC